MTETLSVSGTLLVCCLLLGLAPSASAGTTGGDTIYTYSGNPFTGFSGSFACPPECGITGSFTIAGPPPDNLTANYAQGPHIDITPIAYSFTDGNTTWTSANSCPDFFQISTDGSGNIINWQMRFFNPSLNSPCGGGPPPFANWTGFQLVTVSAYPPIAIIDIVQEANTANFAALPFDAGTWTTQVVPEPSSVLLLTTALIGALVLMKPGSCSHS